MQTQTVTEAIHQGMGRSVAAMSPEFLTVMSDSIKVVAQSKIEFTTDDVWEEFERNDKRPRVFNPSQIGPAMSQARKANLITKTGRGRASTRPTNHGKMLPVWRSWIGGTGVTDSCPSCNGTGKVSA
jgi:hypothetical protein